MFGLQRNGILLIRPQREKRDNSNPGNKNKAGVEVIMLCIVSTIQRNLSIWKRFYTLKVSVGVCNYHWCQQKTIIPCLNGSKLLKRPFCCLWSGFCFMATQNLFLGWSLVGAIQCPWNDDILPEATAQQCRMPVLFGKFKSTYCTASSL